MKRKNFFGFVVLGIAMSAACFISCSEKDDPFDGQEVVIESNVLEQGADETVNVSEDGTEGTSLTYDSWIRVFRRTNLSETSYEGEIVTVTLNNVIESEGDVLSKTKQAKVTSAASEKSSAGLQLSYEAVGEPQTKGKYVSVQDSALVCTRIVGDTVVVHRLIYQVATYDDGKTKQVMPYYRYENVTDGGVETQSFVTEENGASYNVTRYVSTIFVDFNGETYSSVKIVELKEIITDYLVSSKVINEGKELMEQDNKGTMTGTSKSWIEVEQEWSQSGIKTFKIEVILNNSMTVSHQLYSQEADEMYYGDFQFKREGSLSDAVACDERSEGLVTVTKFQQDYLYSVGDNATGKVFFDVTARYFYEVPVYQDEKLRYEMPYYTYNSQSSSMLFMGDWVEENGVYMHPITGSISSLFSTEALTSDAIWVAKFETELIYRP